MSNNPNDLFAAVWQKVQRTNSLSDCWNWTGDADANGVAVFTWNSSIQRPQNVMYWFWNTANPKVLQQTLTQQCFTPRCCNPLHWTLAVKNTAVKPQIAVTRAQLTEQNKALLAKRKAK